MKMFLVYVVSYLLSHRSGFLNGWEIDPRERELRCECERRGQHTLKQDGEPDPLFWHHSVLAPPSGKSRHCSFKAPNSLTLLLVFNPGIPPGPPVPRYGRVKGPTHQTDTKEHVQTEHDCCVASRLLRLGQQSHWNTPQRLQPTAK